MPIISKIGTRSAKVRVLYGLIYSVLILGAISMIYPFTLMISGSMRSEADSREISAYPKFWTDDTILFQKYTESKYNAATRPISHAWGRSILTFDEISVPEMESEELVELYREWRASERNRW